MTAGKLGGMKPLAPGKYRVVCKEQSVIAAAMNGHSGVWPEAEAVSDGKRVVFYREGKEVFSSNATYAAANFEVTPLP